jgi:putative transposase
VAQVTAAAEAEHARYTYRLRVSSTARAALGAEWDRCRWVWNECVAKSKAVHLHKKATGEKATCGPAQLDRMLTEARARTPWLRAGSSVVQQQVIRDFGRSRAKAHKDIREAGPTLNYTRRGFRLKDGRLHLAGGIVVVVVWSRKLPAQPSSVRVYQDSPGHWYCSFVVPAHVEPLPGTGRALGIDWGVKETATTTSDAYDLPHAGHGKKSRAKLARYDRMMARRRPKKGQPASKGYREAKKLRAKAYKKVARQREDTGRKWAKKVVRDHDAIAVEDFRPKFLARTTMARKAALIEMGRKHRRDIRLVHPRTPRWTARTAMREPSIACRWVSAPTPATRAEPCPHGTRTPQAGYLSGLVSTRLVLTAEGLPPGALLQEAA